MKTQFDEQLKQLDRDIHWDQQRNEKIKQNVLAEIGKQERKAWKFKPFVIASVSMAAFALFAFLVVGNMNPVNETPKPAEVENTRPFGEAEDTDKEKSMFEHEWGEFRDPLDDEDDVKLSEFGGSWTEEDMLNDLSAGIILAHRQLKKFVEGDWNPDYDSLEDEQIYLDLSLYIGQASTAAYHLSADNYLYVDLVNVHSVLGEAYRNKDDAGMTLAYQVVHDLDVAYNGFESDKDSFKVTLYRDATYDAVRSYLGRQ
ncbi:hypothetical protein [Halalkalibacter akibai]|uniref:Uncharacterized protein n=1 Tax=Halalkalibacter akibai (strain ATCC 43226 / DSM 21942 / CIP 109018 / JCM 9157 / 1139) TaxID=1236973 RepID=W4QSE0_HALA3|nr:hypothetical protein [Halalkalibacter akibai]GAE35001.1 hypothetical protein JCM9157_2093 [Halalkalibacter akibai JCM 9157]